MQECGLSGGGRKVRRVVRLKRMVNEPWGRAGKVLNQNHDVL